MINLLDLFYYKTIRCIKKKCKKKFSCKFYHNKIDKRRSILKYKYYPRTCKNKDKCQDENCSYSHNNFEVLYHPNLYKNSYCKENLLKNNCKYNEYCCHAHSDKELRIEILHYYKQDYNFFLFKYKTVFCPLKNFKHSKEKCIYAHNYQDFRRIPKNNYINQKCERWPFDKNIPDIYENKCRFYCKKFHGWKEYNFHFSNYKKFNCDNDYCKYKLRCKKVHTNYENKLNFFDKKNCFNIVPRNINKKN